LLKGSLPTNEEIATFLKSVMEKRAMSLGKRPQIPLQLVQLHRFFFESVSIRISPHGAVRSGAFIPGMKWDGSLQAVAVYVRIVLRRANVRVAVAAPARCERSARPPVNGWRNYAAACAADLFVSAAPATYFLDEHPKHSRVSTLPPRLTKTQGCASRRAARS